MRLRSTVLNSGARILFNCMRVWISMESCHQAMETVLRSQTMQLNDTCTVSVLNRNVPVKPDGSWVLPNVPANFGQVRARATCVQNGITTSGQSAYFTLPANGTINLPHIQLGNTTPIPTSLMIVAPT